jgi:hypothetical protein
MVLLTSLIFIPSPFFFLSSLKAGESALWMALNPPFVPKNVLFLISQGADVFEIFKVSIVFLLFSPYSFILFILDVCLCLLVLLPLPAFSHILILSSPLISSHQGGLTPMMFAAKYGSKAVFDAIYEQYGDEEVNKETKV